MTLPAELAAALARFDAGRAVLAAQPRAEPLAGGLTNRSWRVVGGGADWVVRLGGGRDAQLAIDRRAELAALRAAGAAGLAPAVVHAEPASGTLVLGHVQGRVWTRDDARTTANLRRLGARVRGLHALAAPADLPTLDVAAALRRYLQSDCAPGPMPRDRLAACAERALADYRPADRAFCHHDLHHLNVVDAGDLVFVDWEYAAVGDPWLDLAACAAYHDLDDARRAALLDAYGAPGGARELARAVAVFDCLQAAWYDVAGRWAELPPQRRASLLARLSRIR